jgi:hypothetical protein
MTTSTIGRRQMLRGAGVAAGGIAIGGVGLASPAMAATSDDEENGLTGSWRITRQDEGESQRITAVLSFTAGGVAIAHDISPAGPPFTGAWRELEDDRFRAVFWSGFPGEGGPGSAGPTVRVRARGKVTDDRIAGSYDVTVFAPGSDDVIESGSGRFQGFRMSA